MKFIEESDCLTRQRYKMCFFHLHTLSRDIPFGFLEVDLIPFCISQFAGADKNQRRQSQSTARNNASLVAIDSPKKRANSFWLCYGSKGRALGRFQCTPKISGRDT